MSIRSVRVHLVHGTWANGWLKPKAAWFEAGSHTHETLKAVLPQGSVIDSFRWSGRNSVQARTDAAAALATHLSLSLKSYPLSRHFVVGHSHGGTIAAEALGILEGLGALRSNLRGLLCLATPFVHLAEPSVAQRRTSLLAISALGYAIYWLAILILFPTVPAVLSDFVFGPLMVIKSLIVYVLLLIGAHTFLHRNPVRPTLRPPAVPVYLFRASECGHLI